MRLSQFIARRYLFAKKSHNVINIISAVSAIGMAIGTAALIIILSVYNGFNNLITESLNMQDPDLLVIPSSGKVFIPSADGFAWMQEQDIVSGSGCILKENVFLSYESRQGLAVAKGVEDESLYKDGIPQCAVGTELAYRMGINVNFLSKLEIYFPDRERNISMTNPMASLHSIKLSPGRIVSVNSGDANNMLYLPLEEFRQLMGYKDEVSGVELWLDPSASKAQTRRFVKELGEHLGEDFIIQDRYQQNSTLFKMMRYEKASIFLILIFVIIIIAFNIFGSLSMLIIEKKGDIGTLYSLGMPEKKIRRIFIQEGWFISLLGLAAGLVVGLLFAFIQQKTGLIKMPGNYVVDAYPVIIKGSDIAITSICVAAIGYLIAILPARTTDPRWEE